MSMQSLIIASSQSLYGLSVVLRTEGISFSSANCPEYPGVTLLDVKELRQEFKPAIDTKIFFVLSTLEDGKQSKELVENIFGISCRSTVRTKKGILRFKKGPVFKKVTFLLNSFDLSEVFIPVDGLIECEIRSGVEVLAEMEVSRKSYPAIVSVDGHFLFTFDIGRSFSSLLAESYADNNKKQKPLSLISNFAYQIAPYNLRLATYRILLKQARRRQSKVDHFTTQAPIDPSGWVLYQTFINALDWSSHFVPRIWKWPCAFAYAFCFTHDVEPRRYAYYKGLPKLLKTLKELTIRSTISLVSEPPFCLPEDSVKKLEEEGHEVISHGLYHNGTFHNISSSRRELEIRDSFLKLEKVTGKSIRGFRAPWLQRTSDLGELLEKQDVSFDSSFVDTDTSLKRTFNGKGISFNFPFRLFSGGSEIKEYEVLELPLTGPQDMEPYFSGLNVEDCKKVFKRKLGWIESIGGLYVFLAHAGVYGDRDSEMRMDLLRYLYTLVKGKDVWIAKLSELVDWWRKRENLRIKSDNQVGAENLLFEVENRGEQTVSNSSIAIPLKLPVKGVSIDGNKEDLIDRNEHVLVPLPTIRAGERTEVRLLTRTR